MNMETKKQITGIYKITCTTTGKIYIGSAEWIYKRFYFHKYDLGKGLHHSEKLQNAWNKYGKDCFAFEIIEECKKQNLLEREQYWIDYYNSYHLGFNCNPKAINCEGRVVNVSTREKISKKLKGRPITYLRPANFYDAASAAKMKEIFQYGLDGNFIAKFNSIKEAEESNGINRGRISSSIYTKANYANGFLWFTEYKSEKAVRPSRKQMSEETKRKISLRHKSNPDWSEKMKNAWRQRKLIEV